MTGSDTVVEIAISHYDFPPGLGRVARDRVGAAGGCAAAKHDHRHKGQNNGIADDSQRATGTSMPNMMAQLEQNR